MSDRVTVGCPDCGARFKVGSDAVGRRAKCRECGEVFTIATDATSGSVAPKPAGLAATKPAAVAAAGKAKPNAGSTSPRGKSVPAVAPAAAAQPSPAQDPPDFGEYDVAEQDIVAPPLAPLRATATTSAKPAGRFGGGKASAAPAKAGSWRDNKGKGDSGDAAPMWKRIGGGVLTLLVVLSIVGKIVRTYNRATRDDSVASRDTRSSSYAGGRGDMAAAQDPPPRTGPFPAITPIAFTAGPDHQLGQVELSGRHAERTSVRLYLPPGEHAAGSLPCVFVCPAGSNLMVGVPFGEDEHEDFLPLLKAGVAVCFYTLDGTVQDMESMSEPEFERSMVAYRRSDGGLRNLADAIDAVVEGAPMIDATRLGTSGHSSAATIALMAAAREPRISTAAVMAPAIDLPARLGDELMTAIDEQERRFLHAASPAEVPAVTHPIYIYHARDDDNCPASESSAFAQKHGNLVTLELADQGGHVGAYYQGKDKAFRFLAKTLNASNAASMVQ